MDFVCEGNGNRIEEFLGKVGELGHGERVKVNYEIVKKLPDHF